MDIFRKILAVPLILCGILFFLIFIVAILKAEPFDFIFGMFIISLTFFFFGLLIWPKKEMKNLSKSNIKTTNSIKREHMENVPNENQIYSENRPLPELSNTIKQEIFLPMSDNFNETGWLDGSDEAIPINLLCYLHYRDANGQESKRRVTLKEMEPWKNEYAFLAYCHERQAHRTFKLSGIISLCNLETGELIDNIHQYFVDRYNDSPLGRFTKLMKVIGEQVLVLVFIARADGRMTAKERKVISDFIIKKSDSEIDPSVLDQEVKMMYCELLDFNKYIKRLKSLDQNDKDLFLQTINLIIECDKKADPMEIAARDKIEKVIIA